MARRHPNASARPPETPNPPDPILDRRWVRTPVDLGLRLFGARVVRLARAARRAADRQALSVDAREALEVGLDDPARAPPHAASDEAQVTS